MNIDLTIDIKKHELIIENNITKYETFKEKNSINGDLTSLNSIEEDQINDVIILDKSIIDEINLNILTHKLILTVIETKYLALNTKIVITPYSIDNKLHILGEPFLFGKNLPTNSYNFEENEDVLNSQFEITFDQSKIYLK